MRASGFFLSLLLLASSAAAQVQQAGVDGAVSDLSGTPLPGVTIELRDLATNYARIATSDVAGRYRIANLPPGMYALTAELSGFVPSRRPVELTIGQTAHVNVAMRLQSVQETVEVTAILAGIDTTAAAAPAVVDTERIEELPVQSRNYLDFVLLTPGVVATPHGGASTGGATAPDSGFSFAGQRPRSNALTIDGLDNNDEFSGAVRTELSLETVKEFDVVSHGSPAETGGGAGGSINVVTKSGTNVVHGDAFVFRQEGRLDARPFDEGGAKPPLRRYRTGGAIGGPLARDRTFYYIAGEYESAESAAASGIADGPRNAINTALLRLRGDSTPLLSAGLFPIDRREVELSGKLNHQLTPATSLVARVAANNNREGAGAFNTRTLVDRSARGSTHTSDAAATIAVMSIAGTEATNEVRGQMAQRSTAARTGDDDGPGVIIASVAEFGRPYAGHGKHRQTYLELGDTATIGRGSHLFRIGADITRVHVTGHTEDGNRGLYLFRSLDAFVTGAADSYRQTFGETASVIGATRYSTFAQDEWTHGGVTVSGGLRLDGERLPTRLHVTNVQWQPRVGVAWTPRADWVVRATAGVFADRIPLVAIEKPLLLNGSSAFEQVFDATAAAALFSETRGGSLAAPLTTVPRSRYSARSGSWTPSSRQFSVGAEHALTPNLSASVMLLRADGRHLLRTINKALVSGPARDGEVFELQSTASSRYTGCTIALNRRMADEIEWSASYTLSKATDDASDFNEQPANPANLAAERAPSLYDQRHRFTASALFEFGDEGEQSSGLGWWTDVLRHVQVAPILAIQSGGRANPLTGIDSAATHAYPLTERPAGYSRNSLRLPTSAVLNLRLVKYVPFRPHSRADFVIEAFNILNRRNVVEVGTYRGVEPIPVSTFGAPTRTGDARQVQLSLDVEF